MSTKRDLLQVQEDVAQALLSCSLFDDFNVVTWRKLKLQNQMDFQTIWNTPRHGKVGAGLLVEMPVFDVPHPDIPGPMKEVTLSVVALEQPDVNNVEGQGTLVPAEDLAELVLECLHHSNVAGPNVITAARPAIVPAEEFKGLVAYRVLFLTERPKVQADRAALATYGLSGYTVTLTPATNTEVWFTKDGSFPARNLTESTARRYTAPFTVASGETVRWAAYQAGKFPSYFSQKDIV